MIFKVFEINSYEGKREYVSLLSSLDCINPYSQLDYMDVFSEGLENLVCFSYFNEVSDSRVIMPIHINPIQIEEEKTEFFDTVTPYGYSGPISSANASEIDVTEFWRNVDNWYFENNVVSEFVRFNLSNNHLNYSGEVVQTMLNIKGEILDEDIQWKSFDRKVRKNVNKAKRENLVGNVYFMSTIDEDKILEFYNIYIETMIRTNALEKFHYSLENFKKFIKFNNEYCAICTVYLDNTPIASELVLKSKDSIYSFLGGTDERFFDKRPNDFLKVKVIDWGRKQNLKYYVLGGGYGLEDGIFKYKKCFFPNDIVNYYTGRKIVNRELYTGLIEKTNKYRTSVGLLELDLKDESFFPLYKLTS
ncbi:GNAT family N-acetyltransferase [Tenacibaculum aiptasiae]|uniref:GNAT family N-acetyltransferase n=1 Tax=Tenacibaculum aiptasiae TaxID=426481 RepID=UPI00232C92CE|nr:GNAT family N-acetyltransferase [Tenacibaculum aiptasiae]